MMPAKPNQAGDNSQLASWLNPPCGQGEDNQQAKPAKHSRQAY